MNQNYPSKFLSPNGWISSLPSDILYSVSDQTNKAEKPSHIVPFPQQSPVTFAISQSDFFYAKPPSNFKGRKRQVTTQKSISNDRPGNTFDTFNDTSAIRFASLAITQCWVTLKLLVLKLQFHHKDASAPHGCVSTTLELTLLYALALEAGKSACVSSWKDGVRAS